jgi:hypothetical protein
MDTRPLDAEIIKIFRKSADHELRSLLFALALLGAGYLRSSDRSGSGVSALANSWLHGHTGTPCKACQWW